MRDLSTKLCREVLLGTLRLLEMEVPAELTQGSYGFPITPSAGNLVSKNISSRQFVNKDNRTL